MLRSIAGLLLAVLLVTPAHAAAPTLPCNTPQELLAAVRYSLENQDTKLFWRLHCWTNICEKAERIQKGVYAVYFKEAPSDVLTFKSFKSVQPPPAWYTNASKGQRSSTLRFNIPLKGVIFFRQHTTRTHESPALKKPLVSSMDSDGELPFGMTEDGTFWIAVLLPSTRTNRPPTIPSSIFTNLHH